MAHWAAPPWSVKYSCSSSACKSYSLVETNIFLQNQLRKNQNDFVCFTSTIIVSKCLFFFSVVSLLFFEGWGFFWTNWEMMSCPQTVAVSPCKCGWGTKTLITASLALCNTPEASNSHRKQSNGLQQVGQSEQRTCQVTWSHCFHRKGVPSVSFNLVGHTADSWPALWGWNTNSSISYLNFKNIIYIYIILYYLYILYHIAIAYLYIYIYTLHKNLWLIFMDSSNLNSKSIWEVYSC